MSLSQVVPNLSFVSAHSYSTQPHQELQTFGSRSPFSTLERERKPRPGDDTKSTNGSPFNASDGVGPDALNRGFLAADTPDNNRDYSNAAFQQQQTPSVHCTPFRKGLPLQQKPPYDNWRPGQYPPGLGFSHHRGYHIDSDDVTTMASEDTDLVSAQFSCADISDALRSREPHKIAPRPTSRDRDSLADDDAATTTSGSYVVDPTDLCNEIDDLFFKDMVV